MTQDINKPIYTKLAGAAKLIASTPTVRYILRGEPGLGKTALVYALQDLLGYPVARIDCANLSLGDLAIPVPNHDNSTINWYHNARFKLQDGKPVIVVLDEFPKAGEEEMNMLHPLLEVNDPRLGDVPVPEGSVIFLTGNMDSDGVGDELGEHTRQRLVELIIQKPNAEEWLKWAAGNNIHPLVMAWVDRFPYALDSYLDGNVNEFNFDPTKPQRNVVSGRVLEIASRILHQRETINDDDALLSALCGAGGRPFGESIMSFLAFNDAMPPFQSIVDDPTGTRIPAEAGARSVMIYGLISRLTRDNFDAVMAYVKRFDESDPEWLMVFGLSVSHNPQVKDLGYNNGSYTSWLREHEDLL